MDSRNLRLLLALACTMMIMYLCSTLFPRHIQANIQATRAARAAATGGSGGGRAPAALNGTGCRAAVYNGLPWHVDVMMGLAYAAQQAGCEPDVFFGAPPRMAPVANDWGMRAVAAPWLPAAWRRPEDLAAQLADYQLVIFVTFPDVPDVNVPQLRALLEAREALPPAVRDAQRFLLTVHNPDKLALPELGAAAMLGDGRWADALRFATIAPFVSTATEDVLRALGVPVAGGAPIPWIAPAFPLPTVPAADAGAGGPALCIQGGISQKRRDYAGAFAAAEERLPALRALNASLLLLGSPEPGEALEIPAALAGMVQILEKLPFQEYYAALRRCAAMLTAFASDRYLRDTASSTVAMALNVGAPLLSTARLAEAYTFLDPASVFVFDPGEAGSYGAALERAAEEGVGGPAAAAMARSKAAALEHGAAVVRGVLAGRSPGT